MHWKTITTISIVAIILATSIQSLPVFAATTTPTKQLSTTIMHDMTINIVLVGFTPRYIDTSYFEWNLEREIAPIIQVYERTYGNKFNVTYSTMFASLRFEENLRNYLKSNASLMKATPEDPNPYAVINALSTEDWLNEHSPDFGGVPSNGYTLLIANMSTVSEHYHYYAVSYFDKDAYSPRAKYYGDQFPLTCWMFSWGGKYRFYLIDLSAGDPKYFYSGIYHIPIQDFFPEYRPLTTSSVTGYVSDYAYEVVRNLFVPSYCYSPTYSKSFRIEVLLLDNTTRITPANYTQVISPSLIKSAFSEVIPYATWDAKISYRALQSDLALYSVVKKNLVYDFWQTYKNETIHFMYFDYRPIYSYLQAHLSNYIDTSGNVTVLPVFCFVFSSGGNLANTWEEFIGLKSRTDPNGLWGISLPEMVLISHSERDVFYRGFGLSQTVIHETGHSIGLMHPFSYGETEDYVASAMSYSTYEYRFSQFDKDAVQRAHADYFIDSVKEKLSEAQLVSYEDPIATSYRSQAQTEYSSALEAYSNQNYKEAIDHLNSVSVLIDRAFTAEITSIQQKISAASNLECPQAQTLIQKATDELAAARTSYQNGSYRSAYQRKATASTYVDQAKTVEQAFQQAKTAINEAQQKIDAVGKLESPEANSLFQKAIAELTAARTNYQNGDYKTAYQNALNASIYIGQTKNAEQAYTAINNAQQIISAIGKPESPQAQTLVQKAMNDLLVAQRSYQSKDYGSAYQYTITIPIYIEQANATEQVYQQAKTQAKTAINEASQKISAAGRIESPEANTMLQKAKDELASAESSFEKGDHESAYQHAQASSIYTGNAKVAEEVYQRQRLIYASVGLASGALLSSGIWLWYSKRKKLLAVPPSAPPPTGPAKVYCIYCGTENAVASRYCYKCGNKLS